MEPLHRHEIAQKTKGQGMMQFLRGLPGSLKKWFTRFDHQAELAAVLMTHRLAQALVFL